MRKRPEELERAKLQASMSVPVTGHAEADVAECPDRGSTDHEVARYVAVFQFQAVLMRVNDLPRQAVL